MSSYSNRGRYYEEEESSSEEDYSDSQQYSAEKEQDSASENESGQEEASSSAEDSGDEEGSEEESGQSSVEEYGVEEDSEEDDSQDSYDDDEGDDDSQDSNDEDEGDGACQPTNGWKPDPHDHRDHVYVPPTQRPSRPTTQKKARKVDLRKDNFPPIFDQGQLESCTANALSTAFALVFKKQKHGTFIPSRLFIWYHQRLKSRTVNKNCGAHLRDGLDSLKTIGACSEDDWKYNPYGSWKKNMIFENGARAALKPPASAYNKAIKHKGIKYMAIKRDIKHLCGCLDEGYPFVFGFKEFANFQSSVKKPKWTVAMPGKKDKLLGGHAVTAVGYDDAKKCFIVQNSWG